jgi:hypothetical protein
MWYGAIPLVFELSLMLSGLERLFIPPHTHTRTVIQPHRGRAFYREK